MVEPGPPRRVRRRRGPALHGQVNRLQVRREGRMLGIALQGRRQARAVIGHAHLQVAVPSAPHDLHGDKPRGLGIVVKDILAQLRDRRHITRVVGPIWQPLLQDLEDLVQEGWEVGAGLEPGYVEEEGRGQTLRLTGWGDGHGHGWLDPGDRVHDREEGASPRILMHGGIIGPEDRIVPGLPQRVARGRQLHQGGGR
jgi:hypothetical protein